MAKKKCKKPVKTPVVANIGPPKDGCPQGYVWNGSQCVKDVG